jgi:hypothetical protein
VGQVLVDGGTGKLKALLVGLISLSVSACGLLPVPLSYFNYGRLAYDANQIVQDDTTTTDAAISMTTGMDCRIFNVLNSKKVCEQKK